VEATNLAWDRKSAWAELMKPHTRLDAPEEEERPLWTFRTLGAPGNEKLALATDETKAKREVNLLTKTLKSGLDDQVPKHPLWLPGATRPACITPWSVPHREFVSAAFHSTSRPQIPVRGCGDYGKSSPAGLLWYPCPGRL